MCKKSNEGYHRCKAFESKLHLKEDLYLVDSILPRYACESLYELKQDNEYL